MRFRNILQSQGADLSRRIIDARPAALEELERSRDWIESNVKFEDDQQSLEVKTTQGIGVLATRKGGVVVYWTSEALISEDDFRASYRPEFAAKAIDHEQIGFSANNEWTSDLARENGGTVRYGAPLTLFPEAVQHLIMQSLVQDFAD